MQHSNKKCTQFGVYKLACYYDGEWYIMTMLSIAEYSC